MLIIIFLQKYTKMHIVLLCFLLNNVNGCNL